jgi:hypothetical protein
VPEGEQKTTNRHPFELLQQLKGKWDKKHQAEEVCVKIDRI